jgi:hypothetical protein
MAQGPARLQAAATALALASPPIRGKVFARDFDVISATQRFAQRFRFAWAEAAAAQIDNREL